MMHYIDQNDKSQMLVKIHSVTNNFNFKQMLF